MSPTIAAARWAIAVPVALVGSLLIQRLGTKFGGYPLYLAFGPQEWVVWATKCITTPFMAATFLTAVYWCAPIHKRVAISVASAIVIAWGSVLTAGAFSPARFHGWLFALGLLSIAGGVVTFVILWRLSRAKLATKHCHLPTEDV